MQSPIKRVHFGKFAFDVWKDVYEPAEDSFLFAENIGVPKGAEVLDVGTGCGLLGIVAAAKGGNVLAADVNPYAIRCAKHNSELNHVRVKMGFLQTDLFSAFNENAQFDLITFNAPYLPAPEHEAESWIGKAWAGGTNGRQVIDRFIAQASLHLKPNGCILLMQSTLADEQETIRRFNGKRLKASIIAEQKLPFFETLTLIQAKAPPA